MAFSTSLKASALASIAAMGAFALATGSPALADHHGKKAEMSQANIVETAMGTGMHETLVAAVKAAGLVDTLAAPGPYTVFAPTNDAFAKIPEATLTELTTNDTETLGTILTYHVVEGNVDAATLTQAIADAGEGGYTITTVNGGTLTATVVDGDVVLTDAAGGTSTVTATDVAASNGVIHVIDTVLMPQ